MSSRRHQDKKSQEEQEATAHAFQEFVNTFQNDYSNVGKTFVRSGVLFADENKFKTTESQIYKPKPVISTSKNAIKNAIECARILKQQSDLKKKSAEKPKSNLELLKEELKQRHSEKTERERIKAEVLSAPPALSYFEGGDPYSTNLFVANLSTKVTESDLMREFGTFGALASVKIMWPRGGEERNKLFGDTNCGFVAYMSRKDASRALSVMKSRQDMRVGWGKSVELPTNPVYIPPDLLEFYMPPAQSGLPYNAQPHSKQSNQDLDNLLYNSSVKVTIPLNRKVLMLVNRMVEYVVREGPMFEAMIMNNEIRNSEFRFLFDYKSPVHVYYRWKLFSVLQGDSVKNWEMKNFRMFKGGSVWIPPVIPDYSNGMPEELIRKNENFSGLSDNQCDRLVQLIQNLNLRRISIAEAMIFSLQHENAIDDSLDIITQSLDSLTADPPRKIARLYLLSDVLYNCKRENVKVDFDKLENILSKIFRNSLVETYYALKSGDKDLFRSKILRVLRQWDSMPIFSIGAIQEWEKLFPSMSITTTIEDTGENSSSDEPLDGASLLKRSLNSNNEEIIIPKKQDKERDKRVSECLPLHYFVPSKWDTVNPEDVQSQAVNSEKIFYMQAKSDFEKQLENISSSSEDENYSGKRIRIEHSREKSSRDMGSDDESYYKETKRSKYSKLKEERKYENDEKMSGRHGKKKKSDKSEKRRDKKGRKV